MRKLADARDPDEARRVVDALLVAGIEAQARGDDGGEIWVVDHDQLDAARERLEALRAGRVDEAAAKAEAAALRKNAAREHIDHRQRTHDMSRRWGNRSAPGPGLVTTFLIVGSVVVFLAGLLSDASGTGMWNLTIDDFSATETLQRVREGQVWRLVTPIFLHFGIFHLAFNMMWLWRLGGQVEHAHGPWVMIGVVLASALPGNLGQYFVSGPSFGGMSGVVYGLFGFAWMWARFDRTRAYSISGTDTVLMMVWFVVCALGWVGPIANIGHAGGLVAGLLLGLPPWIRHVRARAGQPDFTDGSWAAVHLTGARRLRRRFVDPYVPLWFLAIAGIVIALSR